MVHTAGAAPAAAQWHAVTAELLLPRFQCDNPNVATLQLVLCMAGNELLAICM